MKGRSNFVDDRTRQCDGKIKFRTKAMARRYLRQAPGVPLGKMKVYRCPWCGYFHAGHKAGAKKPAEGA